MAIPGGRRRGIAGGIRRLAGHARRAAAATLKPIAIDLRTDYAGSATLHAFGLGAPFGAPYDIDPSKLTFTARPFGHPDVPPHRVDATIGAPSFVPPEGSGAPADQRLREYAMPITFGKAPGKPGMYEVELHAAEGFARAKDGTPLPFGNWSRPSEKWQLLMWWADETSGDRVLAHKRNQLVGRDVYAYGGSALRCGPNVAAFDASAPLRVVAIEREQRRVAMLWPGVHGGNDLAPRFMAIEPLRFVLRAPPAGHRQSFGGNIEGDDCPAVELADWQIDATFSLKPPPESLDLSRGVQALHVGMKRDDVAWLLGYPTDLAGRVKMLHERTWLYDSGAYSTTTVVFSGDRVTSFQLPSGP